MQYVSTRGGVPAASYSEIVLQGLARDGGLFVPRVYPQVSKETLKNWRGLSYAQLATAVTSLFAKDMQRSDIARLCETTYTPEVYCHGREGTDFKKIAPVVWLEKEFLSSPTVRHSPLKTWRCSIWVRSLNLCLPAKKPV